MGKYIKDLSDVGVNLKFELEGDEPPNLESEDILYQAVRNHGYADFTDDQVEELIRAYGKPTKVEHYISAIYILSLAKYEVKLKEVL